ncbi:hypothetical protein A2483_01485 [Candidatus Peregrinibacteria bacterium RIFOXYC2_FULL_33_13]|nr:MAG: hypothetical protein UR27_C0024G0009 [Candidatus Peregrinibacteria bacterium GW2011_GWA2_33_10]KKP38301.1 MAG: hypothetical protein UR30_C0021G0009 [Candidatus Peregrinibacteria bacterium GW2011_GWC2_33_13]OGJ52830.1 MAG: hypothetical protein A2483_01485 [Candidatus Peregrinibacteria bacterium RIFOXYC2_FULL_33_13]
MPICTNCFSDFEITDEEIKFLERISPVFPANGTGDGKKFQIPEPKMCSDCRLANRTAHRNEQYLHSNKSYITGKPLISLYSQEAEFSKNYKICTIEEWWSDSWDALDYGQDFDFNRPFFEQFYELSMKIPHANLMQMNNENSPYSTGTAYCKNCHMINCSENDENCYYGKLIQSCRDIMDSDYVYDSELIYGSFYVRKCYNCKYVSYCQDCTDCLFSENLRGCKNCFLCTNLINKEFCYLNQQLSKEEYQEKVKNVLASPELLKECFTLLDDLRKKRIYKFANVVNCDNSTGDLLINCRNCTDCFEVNDSQDCKYVTVGVNTQDLIDCSNMYLKPEFCYQTLGTIGVFNVNFCLYVFNSHDVWYSDFCFNCENLFGCSGLRNKKYCIFNKQYSREEYEVLVAKIIEHMTQTQEWGQYFPIKYSPFGYNESVAGLYLPLTKEQAKAKGYNWQDSDPREYKPQNYVVPEKISDVKDDILNEILACAKCGKNYKIISQELKRLREIDFPIPKRCPNCRQEERMKLHNPRKVWYRKCMNCGKDIATTFAPEREEKVYCEECYLAEVY